MDVADDLRRLDSALDAFGDESVELPGVDLMRHSLERRREQLLEQITDQQLDLALTRSPRRGTGGELKLVAGVLASLQDSLSSIAQGLSGSPTARGLIPGAIVESVELRVAAASPGSLKLILRPAFPETQEPLFEDGEESTLDLSVGRLTRVLSKAHDHPDEILGSLTELGPRATTHIQSFAKTLADANANVDFRWRSPRGEAAARLDSVGAATLREVIASVVESERTVVYTGRLVGGSLVRATFELELDDGSLLRGAVDGDVLGDLERLFGQPCTATIVIRELALRTGETKEAHRLARLSL